RSTKTNKNASASAGAFLLQIVRQYQSCGNQHCERLHHQDDIWIRLDGGRGYFHGKALLRADDLSHCVSVLNKSLGIKKYINLTCFPIY
ncbi:MAG TPA: hypothetical protein PLI15_17075, partial [Anaerolineales bacterium]|nr:hypothetical protein [Anaerolineales bacterium]